MAAVLPTPIRTLFSHFPLYTYPHTSSPYRAQPIRTPTLWVHPPRPCSHSDVLSSDVECLEWQAYVALRFSQTVEPMRIAVRWDVSPSGAVDGRLPNLHVPLDSLPPSLIGGDKDKRVKDDGEGEVLPAHHIPDWVSGRLREEPDELEGYKDVEARDESRAWVALLEGNVHAALVCDFIYYCELAVMPFCTWKGRVQPKQLQPAVHALSRPGLVVFPVSRRHSFNIA